MRRVASRTPPVILLEEEGGPKYDTRLTKYVVDAPRNIPRFCARYLSRVCISDRPSMPPVTPNQNSGEGKRTANGGGLPATML